MKSPVRDNGASWAEKHSPKSGHSEDALTALFLQGGGALGAYQGGAYAAMAEAGIHPDWVSGISIGAINGALIAGNRPEQAASKLKAFWDDLSHGTDPNAAFTTGVQGFFKPEPGALHDMMPAQMKMFVFNPFGHVSSLADPSEMYKTLKRYVDFDYLNSPENPTRLNVGTAIQKNRELVYFDTRPPHTKPPAKTEGVMRNQMEMRKTRIEPKHIMASAALTPFFPGVKLEDGISYVDAGLVSNSPVRFAFDTKQLKPNMIVFRPDLLDPNGKEPTTIAESMIRTLETILTTPYTDLNGRVAGHVHTVCQRRPDQNAAKMFDFSSHAVQANWSAGYENMREAIAEYRKKALRNHSGTINAGNGHDVSQAIIPAPSFRR